MSGKNAGVSIKVLKVNPKALYLHCYAHSLNLAVQDTTKQCTIIRDAMDVTNEFTKLVKASPKREAWLEKLKTEQGTSPTISPKEVSEETTDSDTRAKVLEVLSKMREYSFLFGLVLADKVYGITEILSKTLQTESPTASEARQHALSVMTMLTSMRDEDEFLRQLSDFEEKREMFGRELSIEVRYRRLFFEVIDHAISTIKKRFTQEGISKQIKLENLICKASNNQQYVEELEETLRFYGDDFQSDMLQCELEMLRLSNTSIKSASDFFCMDKKVLCNVPTEKAGMISLNRHYVMNHMKVRCHADAREKTAVAISANVSELAWCVLMFVPAGTVLTVEKRNLMNLKAMKTKQDGQMEDFGSNR
ncbi:uncharacterized protein [Watersipora subatra]|uniref:uncharacterized protein n=1 Tax=Watersipora subatra TaxID=2589382 RepID=UPI00355C474E